MTELSKETVKRIEEDANSYAGKYNIASIASMAHIGYMAGAIAEATRSMIVEAEKEEMMQAFDKVRKLFEMRRWIMDGRGSYRYDDDRYKKEVRYLYDEFDELQKNTWKNIKTKTFEYRNKIIAEVEAEKDKERELIISKRVADMVELAVNQLTAERDAYKEALQNLVYLKTYKEAMGKTDEYLRQQPISWENARQILNQFNNTENKKQ